MHPLSAHRALRVSRIGVVFATIAFLSTGCLCSFKKEWNEAQRCGIPCDNLAGLWEGTWESEHNGHHGTLRAIITRCADGRYKARYYATFAVIIPYSYDTVHHASEGEGATHFCGEEDLGCLAGGLYRTSGTADGLSFVARYKADKDYGVFRMWRVGTCRECSAACHAASVATPIAVSTEPVTTETKEPAAPPATPR